MAKKKTNFNVNKHNRIKCEKYKHSLELILSL